MAPKGSIETGESDAKTANLDELTTGDRARVVWRTFDTDEERRERTGDVVEVIPSGVEGREVWAVEFDTGDGAIRVFAGGSVMDVDEGVELGYGARITPPVAADGGYCFAETDVDGKTVKCEKAPGHDGDHAGHIPEDAPGLTWDVHEWSDDEQTAENDSDGGDELATDGGRSHSVTCRVCGEGAPGKCVREFNGDLGRRQTELINYDMLRDLTENPERTVVLCQDPGSSWYVIHTSERPDGDRGRHDRGRELSEDQRAMLGGERATDEGDDEGDEPELVTDGGRDVERCDRCDEVLDVEASDAVRARESTGFGPHNTEKRVFCSDDCRARYFGKDPVIDQSDQLELDDYDIPGWDAGTLYASAGDAAVADGGEEWGVDDVEEGDVIDLPGAGAYRIDRIVPFAASPDKYEATEVFADDGQEWREHHVEHAAAGGAELRKARECAECGDEFVHEFDGRRDVPNDPGLCSVCMGRLGVEPGERDEPGVDTFDEGEAEGGDESDDSGRQARLAPLEDRADVPEAPEGWELVEHDVDPEVITWRRRDGLEVSVVEATRGDAIGDSYYIRRDGERYNRQNRPREDTVENAVAHMREHGDQALATDGGEAIDASATGGETGRTPRDLVKRLADERGVDVDDVLIGSRKRDPMYQGTTSDEKKAEWFAELWRHAVADRDDDRIHVRGVHYATVMRDDTVEPPTRTSWDEYENTNQCYDYLVEASIVARILGTIPIDGVLDERNDQRRLTEYEGHTLEAELMDIDPDPSAVSVPDIPRVDETASLEVRDADDLIDEAARVWRRRGLGHRLGFDRDQLEPYHVELWSEKTLPEEIHDVAENNGVDVVVEGEGDLSYTIAAELADRVDEAGKPAVILYLSDFDPKGDNMASAMAAKLAWLENRGRLTERVVVDQLAITRDQIEEYDLPRKPIDSGGSGQGAKAYDTLVSEWEERKGVGAVELNVLESRLDLFREIVRDGLERLRDPELEEKRRQAWEEWREAFEEAVADAFDADEVSEYLDDVDEWTDEFNRALEDARAHIERLAELREDAPVDDLEDHIAERRDAVDIPELEPPETDAPLPADPLYDSARGYLENSRRVDEHKQGGPGT